VNENQKKFWKLMLLVVPLVVSQIGSYAKARAESMNESKAGYELMKGELETVHANMKTLEQTVNDQNNHIYVLEGKLTLMQELLSKTRSRVAKIHPVDAGTDGDGISDVSEPTKSIERPDPPQLLLKSAPRLPPRFEDVVEKYKEKN
jgi:hypothetical protein